MTLLKHIDICNHWVPGDYSPWYIGNTRQGWLKHDFSETLLQYPELFVSHGEGLQLAPALDTFESRTSTVQGLLTELARQEKIPALRNEPFAVRQQWDAPALMTLDRGAAGIFGIRGYGVHMNGFVRRGNELLLWVGRRAEDKLSAPGKLDHIVAGGQPYGLSLQENLIKEAEEEADISRELAGKAIPCGMLSYRCEREDGLRDDHIFCFDLELPESFVPRNIDGEVAGFELWSAEDVLENLRETEDFKYNVALVLLHFMIRHGVLSPDETGYTELVQGLSRIPAEPV
ncbi:DUF4743 domain-containing protein [Kiloniella sp. b19]|uniref:DUF4743 domain-containing protein n=1 Tax=Kiloniella sp. GXU_MW_B19 TaxID=3141326 RepID=UPI0031DF1EED